MSRDSAYLLDIINSCDRVTSIVERSPYEELYADRVIQDAESTRGRDTDDVFRSTIALRNVIVHQYDGIQLKIIWETATLKVPELRAFVTNLFEESEASPSDD
jgi:uncharacterized protein with HEPN domain